MKAITIISTALAAVALSAAAYGQDITVVSWGGSYTMSQKRAYGEPWQKKTGVTVNWEDYSGGLREIRAQVEAGSVTWDLADVLPHEAIVGCEEGLFLELPLNEFVPAPDGTSMVEDMMVPPPVSCAAPMIFWSYAVFFDKSIFPNDKPKTIADFFDLKKFPGKRGIQSWANANIEMALVADGVPIDKVYDVMSTSEGIDRAFRKLDTIKDHLNFWSSGAQPLELVKNRDVVMAIAFNGRAGAAILAEGEPFEMIWDGQVLEQQYMVILRATKNHDEALEFLKFATAPEQQAGQAKWITYGPMRKSGLDIIMASEPFFYTGANVMPHMPNRNEVMPRTVVADPLWWATYGGAVTERFSAWMDQLNR